MLLAGKLGKGKKKKIAGASMMYAGFAHLDEKKNNKTEKSIFGGASTVALEITVFSLSEADT